MPRSHQEEVTVTAPVWAAARDAPAAEGKGSAPQQPPGGGDRHRADLGGSARRARSRREGQRTAAATRR